MGPFLASASKLKPTRSTRAMVCKMVLEAFLEPHFGCEMLDLALKSVRIRLHKGLGVIGGDFSL